MAQWSIHGIQNKSVMAGLAHIHPSHRLIQCSLYGRLFRLAGIGYYANCTLLTSGDYSSMYVNTPN